MAAIRGWKNVAIGSHDQGLIIAYARSSVAAYRSLSEQADGTVCWEAERVIPGPTNAVNVSLFRTNDFRVGFLVETLTNEIWMIMSDRNWAGMATGAERTVVAVGGGLVGVDIAEIQYLSSACGCEVAKVKGAGLVGASVVYYGPMAACAVRNQGGTVIYISFTDAVANFAGQAAHFLLTDSLGVTFAAVGLSEGEEPHELRLQCSDFNNAEGAVTVCYDGAGTLTGTGGQVIIAFDLSFMPAGLVPVHLDPPVPASVANVGDTVITITFDSNIAGDGIGNESHFTVSGYHWRGDLPIPATWAVSATSLTDAKHLALTVVKFNNAYGDMQVVYDGAGSLAGSAGAVANFARQFTPTGLVSDTAGAAETTRIQGGQATAVVVTYIAYLSTETQDQGTARVSGGGLAAVVVTKINSELP